jgi:hypothetical protein
LPFFFFNLILIYETLIWFLLLVINIFISILIFVSFYEKI